MRVLLCSRIFLKILFLLSTIHLALSVICYDCFDTGPSNANCTREKNCTGSACLLYEGADNKTTTAFCLLGNEYQDTNKLSTGCWLEADGLGKHCLCLSNFCNKLRDRTQVQTYDPFASPIPELAFLNHNPFIDYEYIEDEKNVGTNAKPKPANVLFPAAAEIDLSVSGDSSDNSDAKEDDLVPIDFDEYKDWEDKERKKNLVKTVADRSRETQVFPEDPEPRENPESGVANIISRPEVKIIDEGESKKEGVPRISESESFNHGSMLLPCLIVISISILSSFLVR